MRSPRRLAVSVGALLIVAAILALMIVMVLGRQRFLFTHKVTLHVAFPDVAGLREGAVVRLGGRAVGVVTGIEFSDDPRPEYALVVTFKMRAEHVDRVRGDSEVNIIAQGLLGDKLLDVTIGSPAGAAVSDGGWVRGVAPDDPAKLMATATKVLRELDDTMSLAKRVIDRVDAELVTEAQRTLESIGGAADAAAQAAYELQRTAESVDRQALRDTTRDLADTAADLSAISSSVAAGRGTVGGLLIDPTLYEETKRLLVSMRRNSILKALARLVISREGPAAINDASPQNIVIHPRPAPTPPTPPPAPPRKKRDSVIR